MNVPTYLVAQNIHGPRFTTPQKKSVKIVIDRNDRKRCMLNIFEYIFPVCLSRLREGEGFFIWIWEILVKQSPHSTFNVLQLK